jgi:hypothetical protein
VLRRLHGRRAVLLALLVTTAVIVPFLAADPAAFVHSTVELQTRQRFRPDSTSLLVDLATTFGRPPTWMMSVLPLFGGFVVAWWAGRIQPPGATAVASGVGLSLLAVVLLSKQAYPNYYLTVFVAMTLAAVVDRRGAAEDASTEVEALRRPRRRFARSALEGV